MLRRIVANMSFMRTRESGAPMYIPFGGVRPRRGCYASAGGKPKGPSGAFRVAEAKVRETSYARDGFE